jgi:hypothetical protein
LQRRKFTHNSKHSREITEFEIEVAPINKDYGSFLLHDFRSISDRAKKIKNLQTTFVLAGDFSNLFVSNFDIIVNWHFLVPPLVVFLLCSNTATALASQYPGRAVLPAPHHTLRPLTVHDLET